MKTKLAVLTLLLLAVTGCADWERTTFQSLAAAQAVIHQAQTDYEARILPHNEASFRAITQAKALQTAAVEAMVAYENLKAAQGTAPALQAQQQVVTALLLQLPPLIGSLQALYSATQPATQPTPGGGM
jgi:hypothetical protein